MKRIFSNEGLIDTEKVEQIRSKWKQDIQAALEEADAEERPVFDTGERARRCLC